MSHGAGLLLAPLATADRPAASLPTASAAGMAPALATLNADGVLVVPPMEAVWLSGTEWELREGRGCLSFEVKGGLPPRGAGG